MIQHDNFMIRLLLVLNLIRKMAGGDIYDFLVGNNYPNSPHTQGGMKFAKQISPLLDY